MEYKLATEVSPAMSQNPLGISEEFRTYTKGSTRRHKLLLPARIDRLQMPIYDGYLVESALKASGQPEWEPPI